MRNSLLTFAMIFFVLALQGQKEVIDKVVAQVGGELILLSEVEEQHALLEAQRGVAQPDARCFILDQILLQKLLVNQGKLDSIEVKDEEVEVQLDARIDRILTLMGNDISQFEDYYGQTISQVKDQFREDLRNQLMAERMRGQAMADISVTPSEVRSFFNKIPKDSLPYFNSEVEIGEIVMIPKVNTVEKNQARQKLESLRKRIVEDGEDFAQIAGKYSDDFASARIGGDLGWTKRGKFVPEFEAAAYILEPGEISEVTESEFGFHIIELLERRGNTIHTRHILVKPEITEEDLEKTYHQLDSVRRLIMSDSISFSLAVKKFGDKNTQSYNNDGRMVNPNTGNTFFEVGDLDPDIFFVVDTMDVGGFSAPTLFSMQTGEKAFRIINLQSRTAPHRANLRQDYSKIQAAAIESKRSNFTSDWVEEKVSGTFIHIDPLYDDCQILAKWRVEKKP
ncbi:MAG TPA: peptidylprolyl isomerase [Saprospiraceae bacterium]|nr:peptidylprolyl isomerase [Saprospiraceae bacterium]